MSDVDKEVKRYGNRLPTAASPPPLFQNTTPTAAAAAAAAAAPGARCWNLLVPKLTTAIVLLMTTTLTDSTCNEEQIETCRESALDGRLLVLKGGGQCSPRRYAEFSHLCSVNNYLPNVEYCCCVYDTSVLCCRYHQDWDLFRCQMEEDVIDSTSGIFEEEDENRSSICCPPLEFLLPAVLVPLFVVCCCLVVCLRYRKQCGAVCRCSAQTDDDVSSVSPRKNRNTNERPDFVVACPSSSLTSSDANSTLPLTLHGHPEKALYPPSSPGTSAPAGASLFDYDGEAYFRFYPPSSSSTVEPTAPPLFDDPGSTSCAFCREKRCSGEEEEEENFEEYRGTRYRDIGGRLRPLYRTPRNNFTSGGRGGVQGPLVHRTNFGGASQCQRCATYRKDGTTPPPPSYEQSCNQDS